jgi:hypothetical protein
MVETKHHICEHCGHGVPERSPTCPGCGRPAIPGWKRYARERHPNFVARLLQRYQR